MPGRFIMIGHLIFESNVCKIASIFSFGNAALILSRAVNIINCLFGIYVRRLKKRISTAKISYAFIKQDEGIQYAYS